MNPVHRVSIFSSFLHRKTPKYQLGSFTVQFSAMRTHAPSLVGGLAAASASCLSQNVRPDGREEARRWMMRTVCRFTLNSISRLMRVVILT